ncbi:MAG TPA: DUF92 domain-containing protein [Acidobacteriaceae bacterium]|jgi:uncharacterized protein (TIGR00297 family)|nr:DUF92 domain-containing protein [Acidobacteriaceae bacterium]
MSRGNVDNARGAAGLRWQSQLILLAIVPVTATWLVLAAGPLWAARDPVLGQAAAISIAFAALVYRLRAATAGAAITGGVFTAALYLQRPGWRTSLWPLLALFLLTFAATRFGCRRKEALGTAEGKRGRTASQVAANLGVAALAGIPQLMEGAGVFVGERALVVAMMAAMAEATADTVSSELGQVLGGEPRMITSLRRAPVGTDGGITLIGTVAGCGSAAAVVAVGAVALPLTVREGLIALGAAVAGLLFDSLLGAVPERRGWLNNDAVNTLSTLAAAVLAAVAMRS